MNYRGTRFWHTAKWLIWSNLLITPFFFHPITSPIASSLTSNYVQDVQVYQHLLFSWPLIYIYIYAILILKTYRFTWICPAVHLQRELRPTDMEMSSQRRKPALIRTAKPCCRSARCGAVHLINTHDGSGWCWYYRVYFRVYWYIYIYIL